uniref:glycosyltransferase n=1 Tax=Agathobacter sp. TaxID=2021311 RepID=UPI004057A5D9
MKCLMFGLACGKEQFDKYIKRNKSPYSVAHYLFEVKLIEELQEAFAISHNYILQEPNKSFSDAVIKAKSDDLTEETTTTYLNFVNLPIIKFITLFFSTIIRIIKFAIVTKNDFWILSTINYFPVAMATMIMSKILGRKNIIIFTDCSVGYAYDKQKGAGVKAFFKQLYKKLINGIENSYDGYILFSEPMNELVNLKMKPYCVMEGFFNSDNIDLNECDKLEKFTMLYAGTIIESVGLQNLVEALKRVDLDLELWIYGEGDYKQELMKLSKGDSRIKFFGFIDRKELFQIEKKVSLLVNVRDPHLAYTKYSFPSKTFEYLASGTPFLSTRLMCYPQEYDEYMYSISDNSCETIANKVNEIYLKNPSERLDFGRKAKDFVIKRKNSRVQTEKIINFIREEVGA